MPRELKNVEKLTLSKYGHYKLSVGQYNTHIILLIIRFHFFCVRNINKFFLLLLLLRLLNLQSNKCEIDVDKERSWTKIIALKGLYE